MPGACQGAAAGRYRGGCRSTRCHQAEAGTHLPPSLPAPSGRGAGGRQVSHHRSAAQGAPRLLVPALLRCPGGQRAPRPAPHLPCSLRQPRAPEPPPLSAAAAPCVPPAACRPQDDLSDDEEEYAVRPCPGAAAARGRGACTKGPCPAGSAAPGTGELSQPGGAGPAALKLAAHRQAGPDRRCPLDQLVQPCKGPHHE